MRQRPKALPTPDRMCTLRATKARRRSRNSILRQLHSWYACTGWYDGGHQHSTNSSVRV
jgi:hypothetical protein